MYKLFIFQKYTICYLISSFFSRIKICPWHDLECKEKDVHTLHHGVLVSIFIDEGKA